MKKFFLCIFLVAFGYANVFVWQDLLSSLLEDNGCRVYSSDVNIELQQRLIGAIATLVCYPISLLLVSAIAKFGLRKWRFQELLAALMACLIVGNLGGLLRAMIIVKINLQEAFAAGEIKPALDLITFEIAQWMIYGMCAGLVMTTMVLVPLGLLGDSED